MTAPVPFRLSIPDQDIDDLRDRLARTRFPEQPPGDPWSTGTDLAWLRELVAYWLNGFSWRDAEAALNEHPNFMMPLDGIELHFIHVPGKGPAPMPLLLSHGWPGSIFEFLDIIPLLTDPASHGGDPADAFTVVAPSLPGYGLSFRPGQKRYGVPDMAPLFAELMTVLGHERFLAQGGDWGSMVTTALALRYPERLHGLHLNMMPVGRNSATFQPTTDEERAYAEALKTWTKDETGYQQIQGTKPQTLAYALTDSPAGLAAWIGEKFRSWSDNTGDVWSAVSRDRFLANVSLYWFTATSGSSAWPYYARIHDGAVPGPGDRITLPTGYADFPSEMLHPPRSLCEQNYVNITRWTRMARGGHFAALEQPGLLAEDIRAFARPLRMSAR